MSADENYHGRVNCWCRPVGLPLATELSRDGGDVLLIDSHKTRSFFCKALGVTPRTLEIFEDIGIAQDAFDSGVWLQGVSLPRRLPLAIAYRRGTAAQSLRELCTKAS